MKKIRKVDWRIHWSLCACATALEIGPELPHEARMLITIAMELLLFANRFIKIKMEE